MKEETLQILLKEFHRLHVRFDRLEEKFDRLEEKVDGLEEMVDEDRKLILENKDAIDENTGLLRNLYDYNLLTENDLKRFAKVNKLEFRYG